jgi:hypothetical protein
MKYLIIISLLFLSVISAEAQGFPWRDFKVKTISEVIDTTRKAVRPDDTMFLSANPIMARSEVVFTGKSRPLIENRRAFLKWWTGMLGYGEHYASLYQTEYLYKEGDKEFWLPTETPITKYFDKELKAGDKMILFMISAGGFRDTNGIDCVVLVEEYLLPQNLEKALKPK